MIFSSLRLSIPFLFLPTVVIVAIGSSQTKSSTDEPQKRSALEQAQALKAPESSLLYGGEAEHLDWWNEQTVLLRQARHEWGPKHAQLYEFTRDFQDQFLDPHLLLAFQTRDIGLLARLLQPTSVSHVFKFRLFQPDFAKLFLDELDHHEAAKIPMRRPNGMNRYGAILSDLGFGDLMDGLVGDFLTPLARHLFPQFVGPRDITHNYPFAVRYRVGEDTSLVEHADASVITVNVCLETNPTSKVLYFKEHRTLQRPFLSHNNSISKRTFVDLSQPGEAIIHLGQIVHGVSPMVDQHHTRSNLVVWLFGEHGDVRIAEYEPDESHRHKQEYREFWAERQAEEAETEVCSSHQHNVYYKED